MESFASRLESAEGFQEIFGLVKEAVRESLDRERPGLMLGLSSLGISKEGFIGGMHQIGSDMIILNRSVLRRISEAKPEFLKPYVFSVLLHEYLHSLGVVDEHRARILTYRVCSNIFGEEHPATKIAADINSIAKIVAGNPEPSSGFADLSVVEGFDMESMGYIG